MAISVENQFYLSFTITDPSSGAILQDFIDVNDLGYFTEISEAGHVIPTFELVFETASELVFGLLHEGSSIAVQFGQTVTDNDDYTLYVSKVNSKELGPSRRWFRCVGILAPLEYVSNLTRQIIGPFSGVEGIKQVVTAAGLTFPETNLQSSSDSQYWIQANWSDRKFVSEMCKHSYVESSFIAAAITSDMTFIIKDIRAMAKEAIPVWTFTQHPSSDTGTEILYDPDVDYETNTGFINYWMGYGQQMTVFSLEDADLATISEDVRPVVALTAQLARQAGLQARYQGTALQNENVHDNYWQAALQNITNAAVFGSVKVTLNFQRIFYDVKPLDLVNFIDASIQLPNFGSSKAQSGFYIVGKVARTVRDKRLITTVVLCRESLNDISGNIRVAAPPVAPEPFSVTDTIADTVT